MDHGKKVIAFATDLVEVQKSLHMELKMHFYMEASEAM
jgi:hypothetical protein